MRILVFVSTFLLLMLQFPSLTASNPDSLFALPDSSRVTLWDMHAHRNCAAGYRMEITRNGQQITWIQRDTAGYAYCYCNFDYNVKFGPLEPGDYTTDVYFTESGDTILISLGTINFTILSPLTDSLAVFQPFSSKCGGLYLGLPEKDRKEEIQVGQNYPNPLKEFTSIPLLNPANRPLKIHVYNSMGEIVREIPATDLSGRDILFNSLDNSGNRLPAGIYYYGTDSVTKEQYHRMVILD